jgi:hypothetical protein
MELIWKISDSDISRVRDFISAAQGTPFVQERVKRNLGQTKPRISREAFWHALVGCLLTTQQKSGPDGAVARFLLVRPFPFSYEVCRSKQGLGPCVTQSLSEFRGIRFTNKIGSELGKNMNALEAGLWPQILERLNSLPSDATEKHELPVADFLDDHLAGLGPKQSRNLLQELGLTKYEVPIDSRFTKWLNDFAFPIHLSAASLGDRHYYRFVSRGIQELCAAAGVFPCVLDAAIFASFDSGRWNAASVGAWRLDEGA